MGKGDAGGEAPVDGAIDSAPGGHEHADDAGQAAGEGCGPQRHGDNGIYNQLERSRKQQHSDEVESEDVV